MKACGRQDPHDCVLGAHLVQPTCAHCGAPDPIRGDGGMTLVCARCIAAMGRIVVDPYSVPPTVRDRLLAASLDVADLVAGAWRWTSLWPPTGDGRLIRGGVA